MNENHASPSDNRRQPETTSTALLQCFDDPPGGLPLDSPIVQARLRQQRGRPQSQPPDAASETPEQR